jgi:hypothetical protein
VKRLIDLDQVRVVAADNYKGNPRVYLEILDQRILYTDPYALAMDENLSHYVTEATKPFPHTEVDTEGLADLFRARLGHLLADMLLADSPELLAAWSRTTDREIDYVKPRLEEDRYS